MVGCNPPLAMESRFNSSTIWSKCSRRRSRLAAFRSELLRARAPALLRSALRPRALLARSSLVKVFSVTGLLEEVTRSVRDWFRGCCFGRR